MSAPQDIIIRPIVSEKTTGGMADNKYTFLVDPRADKTQIKIAIETIFNVRVKSVNTVRQVGKMRRMGRFVGRRPNYKKAIITLEEGQRIKVFEEMA